MQLNARLQHLLIDLYDGMS